MTAPDTISFDFVHLDRALKAYWQTWEALQAEIAAHHGVDRTNDPSYRAELLAHFRSLNPGAADADLAGIVEWAAKSWGSAEHQFSSAFGVRLMNAHVTATLLSQSLCEALINSLLAVGLVSSGRTEEFLELERRDLEDKWISGPSVFAASYRLVKGTALTETLREMVQRRNGLVHHKVHVFREGTTVLEGTDWKTYAYKDLVRWTERFFSLPYDLVGNALACGEISAFGVTLDRGRIPQPDVHRARRKR